MNKELLEILNLYAQKRRGESIKQSFIELKKSFIESIKKIITSGTIDIDMDKLPVFAKELFDTYTESKYSTTQADNAILELKTIKEVKESKIEIDKFKFHINIKEAVKKEGEFTYYKQWWKSKHTEGMPVESFVINTNLGLDLRLDKDLLNESHTASFYIRHSKNPIVLNESLLFLKPHSASNDSALSSWQKRIDIGKVTILESAEWEKTIEFTGKLLNGRYTASRADENADFWDLKIIP